MLFNQALDVTLFLEFLESNLPCHPHAVYFGEAPILSLKEGKRILDDILEQASPDFETATDPFQRILQIPDALGQELGPVRPTAPKPSNLAPGLGIGRFGILGRIGRLQEAGHLHLLGLEDVHRKQVREGRLVVGGAVAGPSEAAGNLIQDRVVGQAKVPS